MKTWHDIAGHIDEYDYAHELITRETGMPTNTLIDYITGDHLVPLINACESRQAFLINCYGLLDRSTEQPFPEITDQVERYKAIAASMDSQDISKAVDDVVIYGETPTDLWMFWMHRSNRCQVTRLAKLQSDQVVLLDTFIEAHIQELRDTYFPGWRYNTESKVAIITQLPHTQQPVSWT